MYWAASCGGCEIAVLNLDEVLLDLLGKAEIVFGPAFVDTKYADLEAMPDGSIDVTLFNGGIRTEENVELAHLLRRKSQLLVAFGSCAGSGCVPGIANLHPVQDQLRTVYGGQPSMDNPNRVIPRPRSEVPEGALRLPLLTERLRPLRDVVEVDYSIPGCPPEPHVLAGPVMTLLDGENLPAKGSVLGGGPSTVCAECPRRREGKRVTGFKRVFQIDPDPELCLLEQGLVCMGVATRQGCHALCPKVNMPCIGCYGAPEGIRDQGAAMAGALAAAIDVTKAATVAQRHGDDAVAGYVDDVLDTVPDWVGTFYKFSLAASSLDAAAHLHHPSKQPVRHPAQTAPAE
jgi:F420-non-reducing hydrogenase small subunit